MAKVIEVIEVQVGDEILVRLNGTKREEAIVLSKEVVGDGDAVFLEMAIKGSDGWNDVNVDFNDSDLVILLKRD